MRQRPITNKEVRRMHELRATGMTYDKIAHEIGRSLQTVRRHLVDGEKAKLQKLERDRAARQRSKFISSRKRAGAKKTRPATSVAAVDPDGAAERPSPAFC